MCNLKAHSDASDFLLGALRGPEAALANVLMKDLPLSLRPPPEGGHPPVAFVDWG